MYILTFQVLSRFSAKSLILSRFSHVLGQIRGYFWTWTDKIPISRFSRFPGSTGNPVRGGRGWVGPNMRLWSLLVTLTSEYLILIIYVFSADSHLHQSSVMWKISNFFTRIFTGFCGKDSGHFLWEYSYLTNSFKIW